MEYDPDEVIRSYTNNADIEEDSETTPSLRTEIPREFIRRYIQPEDTVLDAGGGAGINSILMAGVSPAVTFLDLTPRMIQIARKNIEQAGVQQRVRCIQGDICNMSGIPDDSFSFVVCVGDALSYVLDRREAAISELVRVAKKGATLIFGTDSKYGFLRLRLAQGKLEEAREILLTGQTVCGMGPRTHLYTISEMQDLLAANGCTLLEIASTPSVSESVDVLPFFEAGKWDELFALELELCSIPELLGTGEHLLFVARKD